VWWRHEVHNVFFLALSGYLLLWVAIVNGYPVIYPDTQGYLKVSYTLGQPIHHALGYSLFIRLVNLSASPWLIVIAQSIITVFILHSVFKMVIPEGGPARSKSLIFLGLVIFLAFGTTLPWFVGQIMPDVFTGLALLSFFLLLYDSEMSLDRTIPTCVVFCISIGTHITHLLAITVLLALILILRVFSRFRDFWPARRTRSIVSFVIIPMIAVAGLTGLSNCRAGYGFALSPGKSGFLLGRLIESGLAAPYLQRQCKIENLTSCRYLNNMPGTTIEFLWGDHPLLKEMGGWDGAQGEAERIVKGTILFNPVGFAKECVKQTLRQFVTFAYEDCGPITSGPLFEYFRDIYPGEAPRYLLSRQSRCTSPTGCSSGGFGRLERDAAIVAPIYAGVFWCSLGTSLIALFSKRFRLRVANQLFILTLIFLVANASITGSFSMVSERFQGRACWLMAMCCAACLIPYVTHWRGWTHQERSPSFEIADVDSY
jgi:hypothetical protein